MKLPDLSNLRNRLRAILAEVDAAFSAADQYDQDEVAWQAGREVGAQRCLDALTGQRDVGAVREAFADILVAARADAEGCGGDDVSYHEGVAAGVQECISAAAAPVSALVVRLGDV